MKAALADWPLVMCFCTAVESDYSPCERCGGKHPDSPCGVDGFLFVFPLPSLQKRKKKALFKTLNCQGIISPPCFYLVNLLNYLLDC